MNGLVVTWSMFSAACLLLGLIQLFLYWNDRRDPVYPLSALMSFAAATVAFVEMVLFSTPDPERYEQILLWQNLAVFLVVVPLTWSVKLHMPNARSWIALLITVLWLIGLGVNFLLPGNLTFSNIDAVDPRVTPWGDRFFVPKGTSNSWKWLVDLTILLIPAYVIDAAWRSLSPERRTHRIVFTTAVVVFVLFAGGSAIVVDAGILEAPYMVGAAFLSMVLALTWVLAHDAVQARKLAVKVAEAERKAERLMRANVMGEVAAALAHELNQPLTAILGNAQAAEKFLARPEPDLEELAEILADIVRDDKRARDIILNMRKMLRGDDADHEHVDLESATREMINFLKSRPDSSELKLTVSSKGSIPLVCCGLLAVQQVILNLLLNAEQAVREPSAAKPEILVSLRPKRDGAELEVRDFGPGIAEDIRLRLFDPFVTTKESGLGMGLAICRRIVESRGGRLTAENADHGGAIFRLWLPGDGLC